jgi:hypothetical protein
MAEYSAQPEEMGWPQNSGIAHLEEMGWSQDGGDPAHLEEWAGPKMAEYAAHLEEIGWSQDGGILHQPVENGCC